MRAVFESEVHSKVFSVKKVSDALLESDVLDQPTLRGLRVLQRRLSEKQHTDFVRACVRTSFLIEPVVLPKAGTTKFDVRWAERLGDDDPRFSDYATCLEVFANLVGTAVAATATPENQKTLKGYLDNRAIPYEIPVDYLERKVSEPIHTPDNISWFWGGPAHDTVLVRTIIEKLSSAAANVFAKARTDKIKVKTYLTDRVLTGDHKTNREKRWEVHPRSVHFAFRRDCLEIEKTLITQLARFEGAPVEIRDAFAAEGLLDSTEIFRCPVTLDVLSYADFREALQNPAWGKSDFQVGHLNPLKAGVGEDGTGHCAVNIAWISGDGNRIQGHHSLEDTRELISRIARNYSELGIG